LYLAIHVLAGVSERLDRRIEIDAVARGDLVAGDRTAVQAFTAPKAQRSMQGTCT
jgi:hypothetical protein